MNRINLWIDKTTRDEELEKKIPGFEPIIRIKGSILFRGREIPDIAIVDTGAHISLIPFFIWKGLEVEILAEHWTGGVVPEKKMPVNVGYISAKLVDGQGNESKEIRFLSYLASVNRVNLLLGMRDLLERFDIYIKFSENSVWLEEER